MKERNSNIELLRIISMLTIISGHLLEQSGAIDVLEGGHLLYACLMSSGLRISVNIFLLIGCWFMVSSKFKPAHILRIHSQLLYYLYPLTVLVIICGFPFEIGDVVRNMFPILLRPIWFGTAYIYLLLMSPFLLILCQNTDVMGGARF